MGPTSSSVASLALAKLRALKTLHDVAAALGYKPSALSYLLYKRAADSKYVDFTVPKKSGAPRLISAPVPELKELQRRLATLLSNAFEDQERGKRRISHGFRPGQSIGTNASAHVRKRHVFNTDLEDFFPSVNFGRVRGFFIKNKRFRLDPAVATIFAQIACHNNTLPQGAPSSPIISNLVAQHLDMALVRLAKRYGCTYSRYADDLTFSTNQKEFPAAISEWTGGRWIPGHELSRIVRSSGFALNPVKTRMSSAKGRQTVTGLTVNRHVNIRQSYLRYVRVMAHSLFTTGSYHLPEGGMSPPDRKKRRTHRLLNWLSARAPLIYAVVRRAFNIFRLLSGKRSPRLGRLRKQEGSTPEAIADPRKLEGMMAHILHIKRNHFRLFDPDKGIQRLYKSLIFYRRFYANDIPTIVCEGKTDNAYIRLAIRKRAALFPSLVATGTGGSPPKLKVSFIRYHTRSAELLRLTGGEGCIKTLIANYKDNMARYSGRSESDRQPVIVIVDNDKGGASVYAMLDQNFGKKIDLTTGAGVIHIVDNLYLTSTDPRGPSGESCIENSFEQSTLDEKLDGARSFNFKGKTTKATEYGKQEFLERVVIPNQDTIVFDGFDPLLTRIADAMTDYEARKSAAAAAVVPLPAAVASP